MPTHSNNRIVQSITYFLQVLSARATQSGLCYNCERITQWDARMGFYRCMHCDQDPMEHKPDHKAA